MKKTNQIKLSAFIIAVMMFSVNAKAQIIYTDINPDVTNGTYNLDLNNDGTTDYSFATGTNGFCTCSPGGVGLKNLFNPLNSNSGAQVDLNDIIANKQSLGWDTTSELLVYTIAYCYPPHNPEVPRHCVIGGAGGWSGDKYLGLKLLNGGQIYFGWVRIANSGNTVIKEDYAYNSIPNQPILAGETSCAMPTVTLSVSGPLSFCAGDSVTLTANGTGYLYQWKKNGVNISGAKSQTYIAKTAGFYKCKVTNSCGSKTSGGKTVSVPCRNTDSSFLGMTNAELEHIAVFPNPATNSVTIKFPSDEEGEIQIINLFGQIVFYEKIFAEETKIDVSKFSEGMYVVRWSSGENIQTTKFSVMH